MVTTKDWDDFIVYGKPLPREDSIVVPMPKMEELNEKKHEMFLSSNKNAREELDEAIKGLLEQAVYCADLVDELRKNATL